MMTDSNRRGPVLNRAMVAMVLIATAGFVGGCNRGVEPEPAQAVEIRFAPQGQGQQLLVMESRDFVVTATAADAFSCAWWWNDEPAGSGPSFRFTPTAEGRDTLRVTAWAGELERTYYWVIDVVGSAAPIPPVVPQVRAGPGADPGQVALTWKQVAQFDFPLREYVVFLSDEGPITTDNRHLAREMRRQDFRWGIDAYEEGFSADADGLVPGARVWFAVCVTDTLGRLSPVGANGTTVVTRAWWVTGTARDFAGLPIAGLAIDMAVPPRTVLTDAEGAFRLGPLRDIDVAELSTSGTGPGQAPGWYGYRLAARSSDDNRECEFRLIPRHPLDPACDLYDGEFLSYLRHMTRTKASETDTSSGHLYRWEHYPLQIYVPELVSPAGHDYGAAMRLAMGLWNSVMGEVYFTEVSTPGEAQLVCRFDESITGVYGRVDLVLPHGPDLQLGNVIPEQMQVYVNTGIARDDMLRAIALHELGHTLGMYAHSACSASDYLMAQAVSSGTISLPEPIHPDEQLAVRCIRYLPQGEDMSRHLITR